MNQPSAAMYALVSGLTAYGEPGLSTTTSARGATADHKNPAATPSSAVPAITAAKTATPASRRRPAPGGPPPGGRSGAGGSGG